MLASDLRGYNAIVKPIQIYQVIILTNTISPGIFVLNGLIWGTLSLELTS